MLLEMLAEEEFCVVFTTYIVGEKIALLATVEALRHSTKWRIVIFATQNMSHRT